MDANEEEVLSCLRDMEYSDEEDIKEMVENHHINMRQQHQFYLPLNKMSLQWLDLRVFYIRLSQHVIGDESSSPEFLTLNHVPLNQDTLLEVNGLRTSIYADGVSTLLKRDRMDKRSEEVTFVSTDSIRTTGNLKFEVFHADILVLTGTLDLSHNNRVHGESKSHGMIWSMSCDSDIQTSSTVLKEREKHCCGMVSPPPAIEVYVAGCFSGSPIVLSKTLHHCHQRKSLKKGVVTLESIPENDNDSGPLSFQPRQYNPPSCGDRMSPPYNMGMELREGEDGELSWFNAGVRVGVGIGLSVCLGLGIGVGLLIRTYQGTTRNFRRRLL